jgi:manganese oxidase
MPQILALLFVLSLTACEKFPINFLRSSKASYSPQTRDYFISAEDVEWDYAPSGKNLVMPHMGLGVWGQQTKYKKTLYFEYTDATFTKKKPKPEHIGFLGPIIRGVVGDTLKVHFKNMSQAMHTIHPHGVFYDKENEGANYEDAKFAGGNVQPGQEFTYTWTVNERAGPGPQDASSVVWLYHSHVHDFDETYLGLNGVMIITKPEFATKEGTPEDVDRELVNLFLVNNENPAGAEEEQHLKHGINGYIFGNLPGLEAKVGERVRWYLVALGTEVDLHTPHWHGFTVLHEGRRKDVVDLLPAMMTTADMVADNPGSWLYHCHVSDHIAAGMIALFRVTK